MPIPPINQFNTPDFHVIEVTDPGVIRFYAESLGKQINEFRMNYKPRKRCRDLTDWISDVIIETTVQGTSLLEVHIIDPAWTLFMRDQAGVSFIDVDDSGYLWPPVEVNFPQDVSDATWRLVQVRPSTSLTEANVVLVFEDKIASELREHYASSGGVLASFPNETRAEFIQRLIRDANQNPAYPGEVDIRFVHLLPESTFTTADLTLSQRVPGSAKNGDRNNPNKKPPKTVGGVFFGNPPNAVERAVEGIDLSIQAGWEAFLEGLSTSVAPPPPNAGGPQGALVGGLIGVEA